MATCSLYCYNGYLLLILFGHLALILHLQQDLLQLLVLLFQ